MYHLVKFDIDLPDAFGKQLALLTDEEINNVKDRVGNNIYLGECMGKHSCIEGEFEQNHFEVLETYKDDDQFVLEFLKTIGRSFGLDILFAIEEDDEDNEDE